MAKSCSIVLDELAKDEGKEWVNSEFLHGHPYAMAIRSNGSPSFPKWKQNLLIMG